MYNLKIYIFLILFLICLSAMAQQVKTIEGYARMEQPDDKTAAEIKAKVVERAKIDALIATFGTNISENNISIFFNDDYKSSSSFYMFGESDLRGTWIRDIIQPRIEGHMEGNKIIWEAWVKGEAREIIRAKVKFHWKLLANGTSDHQQVEKLYDGDAFYVKFCSPVKGYLMIFMADDGGTVSCVLPEEGEDYCTVEANKWLLFYNVPENPEKSWVATLADDRQVEYDQLYVVFSPNKIAPPIRESNVDNSDLKQYASDGYKYSHLSELSFSDFQKYLGKLLTMDSDVQCEKMLVEIKKR